jgi:hypothetical protein
MKTVIKDTFQAVLRAYQDLGLAREDFHIPLVEIPVEIENKAIKERLQPFEEEDVAFRLQTRSLGTQKEEDFTEEVYSVIPSLHEKRLEQIKYLKQQIILNELYAELAWVEENFSKIESIQALEASARHLFTERITYLKRQIKERMNPTSL